MIMQLILCLMAFLLSVFIFYFLAREFSARSGRELTDKKLSMKKQRK